MNNNFKNEFRKLNQNEIKEIVNRCAGQDILESSINEFNSGNKYFIKYIDNDEYGFWVIEWGWKKIKYDIMPFATGHFEHRIKLTPFRIEFENMAATPYSKPKSRKNLEDYLHIYINKKCPHYIQAIIEETKKFIKMLEINENNKFNLDEEDLFNK